jgi:hypothetical protein
MNDRYTPAAMSALSHLEQARESASAARRAGGELRRTTRLTT